MTLKNIYCKQIGEDTNVCDWYECPFGNRCEAVKRFHLFIQTNDDPDDVQFIDGVLFYTPDSITDQQLGKEDREQVAKRWVNGKQ